MTQVTGTPVTRKNHRESGKTTGFLLVLLLLIAAVLRIARLDVLPPALFRDEAEKVYTAWSLLSTGRDTNGKLLPLFIEVFGVTTSAIYQYATVPFVALLGMNEWSARLPAASAGVMTVLLTFLLTRRFYGLHAAFYAALFLALSPWHLVFSRWAQQGIFLPLLFAGAMLAWSYAVDETRRPGRRIAVLCTSAACLAVAIYAYDVARLFVPLLILPHFVFHWKFIRAHPRWTIAAAATFLLVLTPVLYLVLFQSDAAQARFRFVSIIQAGSSPADVILHFLRNYAAHFSPAFLFTHGDPELRHGAGTGVLTVWEGIALFAGLVVMVIRRRPMDLTLLAWLLLFPVAASLTRIGIPHALRTIVALPALQVIAGVGVYEILGLASARFSSSQSRLRTFGGVAVLLALVSFVPFARAYYSRDYQVDSALNWQYGVKRALAFLNEPGLRDATVYFDATTLYGAEYLVAVYEEIPAREFQSGQYGRYRFVRPGEPFSPIPGLAAYVHVPLVPGPVGWRPIAYFPQDEVSAGPVLMVYLNPALQAHMSQLSEKTPQ